MDIKGSLVDSIHTRLRIYPSRGFIAFLSTLPDEEVIPDNIIKVIGRDSKCKMNKDYANAKPTINLNDDDLKNLKGVNAFIERNRLAHYNANKMDCSVDNYKLKKKEFMSKENCSGKLECTKRASKIPTDEKIIHSKEEKIHSKLFLTTLDIDWVYCYLQEKKRQGVNLPCLHVLLEGADIEMPKNKITQRDPGLEARCNKLRLQQEGEEYTTVSLKITVDDLSVKMKQLEAISYQKRKPLRNPFTLGNWNNYVHKRNKVIKQKKEHQD